MATSWSGFIACHLPELPQINTEEGRPFRAALPCSFTRGVESPARRAARRSGGSPASFRRPGFWAIWFRRYRWLRGTATIITCYSGPSHSFSTLDPTFHMRCQARPAFRDRPGGRATRSSSATNERSAASARRRFAEMSVGFRVRRQASASTVPTAHRPRDLRSSTGRTQARGVLQTRPESHGSVIPAFPYSPRSSPVHRRPALRQRAWSSRRHSLTFRRARPFQAMHPLNSNSSSLARPSRDPAVAQLQTWPPTPLAWVKVLTAKFAEIA